jgi:hypothetical protein
MEAIVMASNSEIALRRFALWVAVGLTVSCLIMASYGMVVLFGDPTGNDLAPLDAEERLPMRDAPLELPELDWSEAEEATGIDIERLT